MHDNGKYRYRRHGAYTSKKGTLETVYREHVPHFQKKQYNNVNGDIERWFGKLESETRSNIFFQFLLTHTLEVFENIEKERNTFNADWSEWFIEVHQFRIKATDKHIGLPTPEGIHTDGVSYIYILAIKRENIAGGESSIYTNDKELILRDTLCAGDSVYLDDNKVMHGVSAISSISGNNDAFRDILVITLFKRNTIDS